MVPLYCFFTICNGDVEDWVELVVLSDSGKGTTLMAQKYLSFLYRILHLHFSFGQLSQSSQRSLKLLTSLKHQWGLLLRKHNSSFSCWNIFSPIHTLSFTACLEKNDVVSSTWQTSFPSTVANTLARHFLSLVYVLLCLISPFRRVLRSNPVHIKFVSLS